MKLPSEFPGPAPLPHIHGASPHERALVLAQEYRHEQPGAKAVQLRDTIICLVGRFDAATTTIRIPSDIMCEMDETE